MLRDKATLGYIGLSDREILVFQSIFRMTEQFHSTFELPRENERRAPDVVFVDKGNAEAMSAWDEFHSRVNPTAIPIYISDSVVNCSGEYHVSRPLNLRKLIDVLEAVKQTYTTSPSNAAAPDAPPQASGLQILVVDDSLPLRTYMHQKILSLFTGPITIDFAENGESAVAQVAKHNYDLVFLDVMMPGIDGYKTCKRIKASKPTYVVLLTSRGSPFDKLRGTMSGCDSYLVKPPQDNDLKRIIADRIKTLASEGVIPSGWLKAVSM